MPQLDFSLELDEGNISRQFCVSCTDSLSRDVSTSNWHALSSRRCSARHLRTWPTTYTWSQKVLDAGFARPSTDRALFHAPHTTHLATGALLLPQHVSGTASQYTCATKTLLTTVSGVNLRRCTGFNVASGAQCDILLSSYWTELIHSHVIITICPLQQHWSRKFATTNRNKNNQECDNQIQVKSSQVNHDHRKQAWKPLFRLLLKTLLLLMTTIK